MKFITLQPTGPNERGNICTKSHLFLNIFFSTIIQVINKLNVWLCIHEKPFKSPKLCLWPLGQ